MLYTYFIQTLFLSLLEVFDNRIMIWVRIIHRKLLEPILYELRFTHCFMRQSSTFIVDSQTILPESFLPRTIRHTSLPKSFLFFLLYFVWQLFQNTFFFFIQTLLQQGCVVIIIFFN